MTRSRNYWAPAAVLLFGVVCLIDVCLIDGPALAVQDDGPLGMIIGLLRDEEPEMRALALQQIREELPGEDVTKKFAELLPDLPTAAQAGLLEALGDRGDAAARPAVLEMLGSEKEPVRAAALRAMGFLGELSDVALLAEKASAGSKLESLAARQSLVKLRGDQINAAIVATMAESKPDVRAELLGVLAARNAKETLPTVIEGAKDSESVVRLAALGALRFLADESHTATIVESVQTAKDSAERAQAQLALLAISSRDGQASVEAIIAGLADADAPARIVLLTALARSGGEKPLAEILARFDDEDQSVSDQAVRLVSGWGDRAAVEHLLKIAQESQSDRHQILAIRGLVRLAGPAEDKPADLETLTQLMELAKRPEEKLLVVGALGGIATDQSLTLATSAMEDSTLAKEAALAAVMIAEKIEAGDKDKIRAAMEKVVQDAKDEAIRGRAKKVLESL